MLRTAFFALLAGVWGASAYANPSAQLSVQVVPVVSTTCGAAGQAATDAAQAGFSSCALYNDFTTTIPNTVGTGLPGNWLDCSYGGPSGAVWYFGSTWYGQDSATCSNVTQTTDPSTSTLALDIPIIYSNLIQGNTSSGYIMMKTTSFNNDTLPTSGLFPFMYQEITFRFDQTPSFNVGAFWDWNPNFNPFTERDSWECGGFIGQKCNTEGSLWCPTGYCSFWPNADVPFSSSFDPTQYHTWGALWTGDGNGNYSACTYVDGVRNACHLDNRPAGANTSAVGVRERLQLEHALYGNVCHNPNLDGDWSCLPNFGTRHLYIKNVKVLSCPSWTSTSAMCNGTTNPDGTFYR